ncbi:MAG: ATP-binding protein, partial [Acidimicrobiia bacterium]|nr:ATP-binding protein [Acidimicrobiia bacterium]
RTTSIFEPHVRILPSNENTDSLGLGLYVSRTLATLMDGTLEYRRDDDRTYFDLVLPAADIEASILSGELPSSELVANP